MITLSIVQTERLIATEQLKIDNTQVHRLENHPRCMGRSGGVYLGELNADHVSSNVYFP